MVHEIIIEPFMHSEHVYDVIHAQLREGTFWCQLSSAFGDTPIIPCLEVAIFRSTWSLRPIDTGVLRLLNPSIRELEITLPRASTDELRLFKVAFADYLPMPYLERLTLEAEDLTPLFDVQSLPSPHHRLRYLKLDCGRPIELGTPIDFNHLRHVTALPDLENLAVCLHSWTPLDLSATPVTFPSLRSLEISCYGFEVIGHLLAHVEFPRLHAFAVTETHESRLSQKLPEYLHTLIAKFPSLMTFEWHSQQEIQRGRGYVGKRRSDAPLAALVAPLLSHRALRHFSLSFRGPIVPHTPTDLRAMAEAWPDLETFKLGDQVDEHYSCAEQYVDVESVLAFARRCPRLRSFHVPMVHFDPWGSESTVVGESARRPPVLHWLRELLVDEVAIPCFRNGSEQDKGRRCREAVVQFRTLMATVFRSAVIRTRSEVATAMTVGAVVSDY